MQWVKLHQAVNGFEVWINLAQIVSMRDDSDPNAVGCYLFIGGGEDTWHVKEKVSDILKLIHPEL